MSYRRPSMEINRPPIVTHTQLPYLVSAPSLHRILDPVETRRREDTGGIVWSGMRVPVRRYFKKFR